jgi:hypothetical protein
MRSNLGATARPFSKIQPIIKMYFEPKGKCKCA